MDVVGAGTLLKEANRSATANLKTLHHSLNDLKSASASIGLSTDRQSFCITPVQKKHSKFSCFDDQHMLVGVQVRPSHHQTRYLLESIAVTSDKISTSSIAISIIIMDISFARPSAIAEGLDLIRVSQAKPYQYNL